MKRNQKKYLNWFAAVGAIALGAVVLNSFTHSTEKNLSNTLANDWSQIESKNPGTSSFYSAAIDREASQIPKADSIVKTKSSAAKKDEADVAALKKAYADQLKKEQEAKKKKLADKKKKKKKKEAAKKKASPAQDAENESPAEEKPVQAADENTAFTGAPLAEATPAIPDEAAIEETQDYAYWENLALSGSKESFEKFLSAYLNHSFSKTWFYTIVGKMLNTNNTNVKNQAIQALGMTPSLESFGYLAFIQQSRTFSSTQQQIAKTYINDTYTDLQYVAILKQALVADKRYIQRRSVQTIQLAAQKYLVRSFNDRNVASPNYPIFQDLANTLGQIMIRLNDPDLSRLMASTQSYILAHIPNNIAAVNP